MRHLLLIGLVIFSATPIGRGAFAKPHDSTSATCAVFEVDLCNGEVDFLGAADHTSDQLIAAAEEFITGMSEELAAADPMFCSADQDEVSRQRYVCELTDSAKREIRCYIDDAQVRRQVTACFMNGDLHESNWELKVEGAARIPIKKFLDLLSIEASIAKGSHRTVHIWQCLNTQTGQVITGTPEEVFEAHQRWLRSIGEEE